MEYGMYRVNKLYIRYLIKSKPWIVDPQTTDLYVGPVQTVNGNWGFFAPVTPKPEDERIFVSEDGAISGFVHVKKMILVPCRRMFLKREKKSSPESEFCLNEDNRRIIKAAAQLLYEADMERNRANRKGEENDFSRYNYKADKERREK